MEERFKNILQKKYIFRGLALFSLFTLAGLLIGFIWKGTRNIISIILSIDLRFLIIMFLLIFVDWILLGYRIFLFTKEISNKIRFLDCFKANLVNTCVGAITPSQTGGSVGQLYILYQAGLPLAGGFTISIITFLSTLLFFLFSIFFVIIFTPYLYAGKIAHLIQYCLAVFGFVVVFFILLLIKPEIVFKLLSIISSSRLVKMNPHIHHIFQLMTQKVKNLINDYKGYTTFFIKRKKRVVLACVFITFVIYINKYLIAYSIAKSLDNSISFHNVFFTQILLTFISYFSPTPGASGISELSATYFMDSFMHEGTALIFTSIWRFSTTYFELIVGGIILIIQLISVKNRL